MKRLLILLAAVALGVSFASAQYFCAKKGAVLEYSMKKDNKEVPHISTVLSVTGPADAPTAVRLETTDTIPGTNGMTVKTYTDLSYDPATGVTKVVLMTADDFKNLMVNTIKDQIAASGQAVSQMQIDEMINAFKASGEIMFEIDPKAAADSKLPKSTLRLTAGMNTMKMNLWNGKFLGFETITVPAGTFECAKISYDIVTMTPGGNQKQMMTDWYAPGVGLVRAVESDKKGEVIEEENLVRISE